MANRFSKDTRDVDLFLALTAGVTIGVLQQLVVIVAIIAAGRPLMLLFLLPLLVVFALLYRVSQVGA